MNYTQPDQNDRTSHDSPNSKVDIRTAGLNTASGLLGTVGGAATILLAVLTEEPAAIVPWALLVLAAIVIISLLPIPWRVRLAATLTVATALTVAGIGIYLSPGLFEQTKVVVQVSPSPTPIISLSPPPAPNPVAVSLIQPDPASAAPVPGCFLVKFRAEPPEGFGFAVAGSSPADPRLYFEGRVSRNPATNEWTAQVSVGTDQAGAGQTFHITIVMIEKQWVDYLSGTRDEPDATWWTSMNTPPNAVVVSKFDIRRNSNPKVECG